MVSNVVQQSDYFNWSLNYLSREFGLARETVSKRLVDAGVQPSGERRGYPVYSVKEAAMAILMPQSSGGPSSMTDPEKMGPSDRRHHYAAENDRIKFEKELGHLVSIEDAREQMAEIVKVTDAFLEMLPDKFESRFPDAPSSFHAELDEEIYQARNNLADKISGEE